MFIQENRKWLSNMAEYNKKYVDFEKVGWKNKPSKNNQILADGVYLSYDRNKTRRNSNVLVVSPVKNKADDGFIVPNIKQTNANYFIFDHDRTIYDKTRETLENEGYEISLIDFTDPDDSDKYNPLEIIVQIQKNKNFDPEDFKPIVCFVKTMVNKDQHSDHFIKSVERFLLFAIIYYLFEEGLLQETNLEKLKEYITMDVVDLERMIMRSSVSEEAMSKTAFKKFKVSNDLNWLKMIQVGLLLDLAFIDDYVLSVCDKTTIDLTQLSQEKKVLFVITPQNRKYEKIQKLIIDQLMMMFCCDKNNSTVRKSFIVRDADMFLGNEFELLYMVMVARKVNLSISSIVETLGPLQNCKDLSNLDILFDTLVCMGLPYGYISNMVKQVIQPPKNELYFDEEERCYVKVRGEYPIKTKIYKDIYKD